MAWLLLGAAIVSLWAVSLGKVFYYSHSLARAGSFAGNSEKRRNVLLVIAHPDDESMFFSPTLLFFALKGHDVHILCMSTGNADGKGEIRNKELYRACAVLKLPPRNIKVLDHPNLQDGFNNLWDHRFLAAIIDEHVKMWNINMIVTFDNYGVSGHRNHCDVHHGTCTFLCNNLDRDVEAWKLISTSIFRKYSGPVDIWLSIFYNLRSSREHSCCLVNNHPRKSYLAMSEHTSQWVWFRKLFVLLSSYTYVNTLCKIVV